MTFSLQPTLIGELVHLAPLDAAHYGALHDVAADPLIWAQHPEVDRHEERRFRVFFDDALASGGALVVTDTRTRAIIGSSRFYGFDAERSEVEIGWTFLARSHWGGAYNREMKQLMLRHAFQFVDIVVFLVGVTNLRSQRAVEKIGGVRTGVRPDAHGARSYVYQMTAARLD